MNAVLDPPITPAQKSTEMARMEHRITLCTVDRETALCSRLPGPGLILLKNRVQLPGKVHRLTVLVRDIEEGKLTTFLVSIIT